MMGDAKPIPTAFGGVQFRSRLEARYAFLFQELGLIWHYEPEGFQLPAGNYLGDFPMESTWYLPDFWLPDAFNSGGCCDSRGCWVEIKPEAPDDRELSLAMALCQSTGKHTLIAYGLPGWVDTTTRYGPTNNFHCWHPGDPIWCDGSPMDTWFAICLSGGAPNVVRPNLKAGAHRFA